MELVRYTSGVDADQSWFVLKTSATRFCFTIVNDAMTVQPWMDLAKGFFPGFARVQPRVDGQGGAAVHAGLLRFPRGPATRRDLVAGTALAGSTTASDYSTGLSETAIISYGAPGNAANSTSFNWRTLFHDPNATYNPGAIILPVGFSATNPAYTSNSNPVFHSMPFMPYITESLPADFGLTFHYATNSFSQGDTFVVSAGTEEWEVLDFAANASAVTGASPLFLARMV